MGVHTYCNTHISTHTYTVRIHKQATATLSLVLSLSPSQMRAHTRLKDKGWRYLIFLSLSTNPMKRPQPTMNVSL